jgi:hypothetical protein
MTKILEPTKFTSLQLELLQLYAINPSEEELLEIKDMLAKYYMRKAISMIGQMEKAKGTTNKDVDKWLNNDTVRVSL